jgi:hypothetical protein
MPSESVLKCDSPTRTLDDSRQLESVEPPSDTRDDKSASSSSNVIFQEERRAFRCISDLSEVRPDDNYQSNDQKLAELRTILDKYLESPSLLDRFIASMIHKLTHAAHPLLRIDKEKQAGTFWKSPLPRILSALYALSKVRGRKRVQKFLPHQVEDVEPVLVTLQSLHGMLKRQDLVQEQSSEFVTDAGETVITGRPELWESIYTLWNWMGILGKVPFDLNVVIDLTLISQLLCLGFDHLSRTGPTREMASACMASWLTRPDLEDSAFQGEFESWSQEVLNDYVSEQDGTGTLLDGRNRGLFATLGTLQTIVTMLKVSTSPREKLLPHMKKSYWSLLSKISTQIASQTMSPNLLLRKYLVKWWTRLGLLYLPPRLASWRYQMGRRSMKKNLHQSPIPAEESQRRHGERHETTVSFGLDNDQHALIDDSFFLVPDEVEVTMGYVLEALKDSSTVVRWSAAKGVGRITGRLPSFCAEDVLDAILTFFHDKERDNDWHGACLALAELARRGLLLPHRLKDVMPKIVAAIQYDVPRRQTSVGSHVRDAACYAYWALARAYSAEIMKPFVSQLGQSVVVTFLFDREVNCRRAASAAFQEMVGRQGAQNFQNGISILTAADYFSLGNRKDAYTKIAFHVAQFEEYSTAIINHLYEIKLSHWDICIRKLSSESLGVVAAIYPQYMVDVVVPYVLEQCLNDKDLQIRHGSTIGLAELVLALGGMKHGEEYLSSDSQKAIAEIVPAIEKKRLYRGKGGEHMRAAVCRLIECISIVKVPLTVPQQVRLLDSVDACIPHPNEMIQEQAGKALHYLMHSYFPVSSKGPSERLQNRVVNKYIKAVRTGSNPATTRGFSMALGCLPAKLLAPSNEVLDLSLTCLCLAARPDAKVGDDRDAETRRNALVSLASICRIVGFHQYVGENHLVGLSLKQMNLVFAAHLRAMNDYNMDRRGDIGSKCRLVAMKGLVTLAEMASSHSDGDNEYFSGHKCLQIVGLLLKQFSEKLDVVRTEAASCLLRFLSCDAPMKPYISSRERLRKALTPPDCCSLDSINWSDASITFPLAMKVAEIDEYFESVISGMVVSVGCITQSVAENASNALIRWARNADDAKRDRLGAGKNKEADRLARFSVRYGFVVSLVRCVLCNSLSGPVRKASTRGQSHPSPVKND